MQGLRHQNPHLFMNLDINVEHELVDLTFLGIQVWSIPKQLHEKGLILGHRKATLSQGIELVELMLNEFLRQIPFPKPFLKQLPLNIFDEHVQLRQEHLPP
jgi:hypothetical protein